MKLQYTDFIEMDRMEERWPSIPAVRPFVTVSDMTAAKLFAWPHNKLNQNEGKPISFLFNKPHLVSHF
jgi:hypothetical protein